MLVTLLLVVANASACPPEQQPQWTTATEAERTAMTRACSAESEARVEAAFTSTAWSRGARIGLQTTVGLTTTAILVTTLLFTATALGWAGLISGLALGPLLVGTLVWGMGDVVGGTGRFGWTLLGSYAGTAAGVGFAFAGMGLELAFATRSYEFAGLGGLIVGGLGGCLLPTFGAILGFELSSRAPALAFVPMRGGGALVLSGRF